jgi:hypothetical protein
MKGISRSSHREDIQNKLGFPLNTNSSLCRADQVTYLCAGRKDEAVVSNRSGAPVLSPTRRGDQDDVH